LIEVEVSPPLCTLTLFCLLHLQLIDIEIQYKMFVCTLLELDLTTQEAADKALVALGATLSDKAMRIYMEGRWNGPARKAWTGNQ